MRLFNPIFVLLLVALLFTGHKTIGAGMARNVLTAIVYGVVALIILISMVLLWITG